jgi:universal stress protein E
VTLKRILVDIDALAPEHPALRRALGLAARTGGAVTIVDVLPGVPPSARRFVSDRIEQELVDDRWKRLRDVAARCRADVPVKPVLLRGRPVIAIVREVLQSGYDLVVRSHGRDLTQPSPFGPVDMQLLRKCPAPVWIVAPGAPERPQRILAAVDCTPEGVEHDELNRIIVDVAATVRDAEDGELTLLNAWTAFGEAMLEKRMSAPEFEAFVAGAEKAARADLDAFTAGLGARRGSMTIALEKGEPHVVIPKYVEDHQIDLVVMGTVARTGLGGFMMGNTAERVLKALRGSVLAVKPRGFVCPVSLTDD